MIVDVLAVCVGADEKGVVALRPAHGRFITYPVGLLRGNLSGQKGLADLIAQHIGVSPLLPSRDRLVFCLAQNKLSVGGHVVALIGRDQLSGLCLVRVLPILKTVFKRLCNGFALADVVGNKPGNCQVCTFSLADEKGGCMLTAAVGTSEQFVPKSIFLFFQLPQPFLGLDKLFYIAIRLSSL